MSDKPVDPFEAAKDLNFRPIIDESYGGMLGLPTAEWAAARTQGADKEGEAAPRLVPTATDHSGDVPSGEIRLPVPEQGPVPGVWDDAKDLHVNTDLYPPKLGDLVATTSLKAGEVAEELTPIAKENKYGWAADVFPGGPIEHYVPNNCFTSMTTYYPWHDFQVNFGFDEKPPVYEDFRKASGELELNNSKVCVALATFFTTVKPSALACGAAMVYRGFAGEREIMHIRFERDHIDPMTFVLRADCYERFIDDWFKAAYSPVAKQKAIDWCLEFNSDPEMQSKGYRKFVCQMAREYPLSWYRMMHHEHEWDGMLNGDFQKIDDTVELFKNRFNRFIAMATKQAEAIAPKIKFRDHNLVLTFKGNATLDGLVIGLDKVPPKLVNGEFQLGEHPINPAEWQDQGNAVMVVIRKIGKVSQWVDQLLKECWASLPDHPYAKETFGKVVKEQLLASSHFIKELYQIQAGDIKGYVEQVASGIVEALNNHGGNIGLDLNTWNVYQYQDNGLPPVPLVTEELSFRKNIYDTHVDRFMDILYTFLAGLKNPYIRPYTHKVLVTGDDGIQIGSIRQVKPEDVIKEKPEPVILSTPQEEAGEVAPE